jgi:hypothetical protein
LPIQAFAGLPIAVSFIGKTTRPGCNLGLIGKLICSADPMTNRLGYAIRTAEGDENIRCRSREFVETLCIMKPVNGDLPPG